MDQDPALATSDDEERAKVRKAQEVVERTSASVVQVCLIILTLLAIVYTLYFGAGIILPFVLALVLAMVLGPAMRVMNRRLHIPRFRLDCQSSAIVSCLDGEAELSAEADPAGRARRARAAKYDVARRAGAGGPAGCDRQATV